MGITTIFTDSTLARYVHAIRHSPKGLIFNHRLLLSALMYAMSGIPITWDQGSASVIPSLPGFQNDFGISSGADAKQITDFVSLVYIGAGVGAAASFFINDRIGRLWSFRLYTTVWIVGQMIATASTGNISALYAARIVSGLGIGALTVTGPVSLVEIAPTEIRGLIGVWFSVAMLLSLFVAVFCTYGVFLQIAPSSLQYQVVFFSPCIFMALVILGSFASCCMESPRWQFLVGKTEEGKQGLITLRGMGPDSPRTLEELEDIENQMNKEKALFGSTVRTTSLSGFKSILKEAFTIKANLRRVQQALLSYSLAQLSGANSVSSYFVPILTIVGATNGERADSLYMTGMYSLAKFFFTLMASFFFIDALGRRKSLFLGITIQMISDLYIGVFIKYKQQGEVAPGSAEGAVAMLFLHGFGYAVGLLVLPYLFGAEVWPNQLRSFGASLAQSWHWLFYFGINRATPPLLARTNNWGAFIFFAGWCFVSLLYTYLVVPETAGQSLEQIDELFEGSWFMAYRAKKVEKRSGQVIDGEDISPARSNEVDDKTLMKVASERV